jgi:alpha-L-arabinofuranosidase
MKSKFIFSIGFLFFFLLKVLGQNKSRSNWDFNPGWNNTTIYTKTYVVNQRHPAASDNNIGTELAPFLTINKAAQMVKAGEKVLIHTGVYNEIIQPLNGGLSPEKMISYEAGLGDKVIIKGSKSIPSAWIQRAVYTDVLPDTNKTYNWSKRTWMITLEDSFFVGNYFPLKLQNIEPNEYPMMPWAKLVKKITPYNNTRGLLFQNGKRLIQLTAYGDVAKIPGSFWVDNDKKTIHLHSFDNGNPNNTLVEIAVNHHLFLPQSIGLNYIQLSGITFEHCANGFLRTSTGAITSLGGHHWIFENNTIRQVNSSGLEFGYYAFEEKDTNPLNLKSPRKKPGAIGGMIVRNNTISECGTAGMRSYVVPDALIEDNHVFNCGWQDAENYWEVAGIKILNVQNSLIRRNHIHNIVGGNGLWLDWDNYGSRVTQNIIHDISTVQGGIFVEASHYPNLVDNNFIWNVDGNGIYANDTDSLKVYHNLIGNISGNAVHAIVATDRSQNGRKLTAENNHIANNIFINGQPSKVSNTSMQENNLYVNTSQPDFFTEKALKDSGENTTSNHIYATVGFNESNLFFSWKTTDSVPEAPVLSILKNDFNGNLKTGKTTKMGPFNEINQNFKVLLKEK